MSPRKKKIAFVQYSTEREALVAIMSGLIFFLINHTKKTIVLLLLLFSGLGYVVHDYITSEKVKVFDAVPVGQESSFTLLPSAFAAERGDSIIIKGKLYGFRDVDVDVWKLKGEPTLLIYDKDGDVVFKLRAEALEHSRMKQFKK
jgi:hypothetical protein